MDRILWEAWQRRIDQQQRSGLSIVAFCRKEGVSPGSFHAWKQKLKGRGSTPHSPQERTAAGTPRWATIERAALKPASPNAKLEASMARIFVHAVPTDMRKSFDGLYALVVHALGKDVFQGDYFVFVNRARDRCKILSR